MSRFLRDGRWSKAARGAQFCEVRVDTDTGEVRITRWLGVFDVGKVINPKTAASQLRGGIVMGIAMALSKQTLVDPRNGRTMSGEPYPIRSNTAAMPIPPPMQSVTSP
jgi:xanthine dehydrogenase YagR molybdenum-binding subunit